LAIVALKQSPAHLNLVLSVSVVLAGKVFGYILANSAMSVFHKWVYKHRYPIFYAVSDKY